MPMYQTLMPIKTKGSLPPLFCVHGEPLKMAMRIQADRPIYGLSHVYHSSFQETVPDSIEELARQYLEDVCKVWPEGPYHLLGFSAGGMTAYEMARQLIASGKKVHSLVMIEPPLGRQAGQLGDKSHYLKHYISESGWNLATLGYLVGRVRKSVFARAGSRLSRLRAAILLKFGRELPESLRWVGYLRALGPAIRKYDYTPIDCPATLLYRELDAEAAALIHQFWSGMLGPDVDIRYEQGASSHNDFMLDPHLSNVGQLLDAKVAPRA
jgi:thioesterase domain-containing protein